MKAKMHEKRIAAAQCYWLFIFNMRRKSDSKEMNRSRWQRSKRLIRHRRKREGNWTKESQLGDWIGRIV